MIGRRQAFDLDGALYKYRDTIAPPKSIDGSFKHFLCSQLQNEQSVLLLVPSPNSLQGKVTKRKQLSQETPVPTFALFSLWRKWICFTSVVFVERPAEGVFWWKSQAVLLSLIQVITSGVPRLWCGPVRGWCNRSADPGTCRLLSPAKKHKCARKH